MKPGRTSSSCEEAEYDCRHVLLVSSGGGHLAQLLALRPWWESRARTWVTFDTAETRSKLRGEHVVHAYHPTTRNLPNLVRNACLATVVVARMRPDLVLSTGAGVALPFFLVARALGLPTVYVEVVDRIGSPSLTGRLCYPLSTTFLVQWPGQLRLYPKASVIGPLV